MGSADPLPDAPDRDVQDRLQELRELLEPVEDGAVPADSDPAKKAAPALRAVLESVLRAPITFPGEAPRSPQVADVKVVVHNVAGHVAGWRGDLQAACGSSTSFRPHPRGRRIGEPVRGLHGMGW